MPTHRTARWALAAVLLVTGLAGLMNGPVEWPQAETTLQRVVQSAVICYGAAGLIAAFAILRRSRRAISVMMVWCASGVVAASAAPVAYAEAPGVVWGALAGGLLVAAFGCAVTWFAAQRGGLE